MQKTMVLVVEYPEEKKADLEKRLKSLVTHVNTTYGEIWCPYDSYSCNELCSILEDIHGTLIERLATKMRFIDEKSREARREIVQAEYNLLKNKISREQVINPKAKPDFDAVN